MRSRLFRSLIHFVNFMRQPAMRRTYIGLALISQLFCYGFGSIEKALELLPSHDELTGIGSYFLVLSLVAIVLFARSWKQTAAEFLWATFPIPVCTFLFLTLVQIVRVAADIYDGAFLQHWTDYLRNFYLVPQTTILLWFTSYVAAFWIPLSAAAFLRLSVSLSMRRRRPALLPARSDNAA